MGKEVSLTVTMLGSASDFTASTKANLVGSFPSEKGTYRIAVESLESGFVRIGQDYNDTAPPVILRYYPDVGPGQVACPGFVTLAVDTDEPAVCKYSNGTDAGSYAAMPYFFDGRGLTHVASLYLQPSLDFAFYARCIDPFGNAMNSSTAIIFSTGTPCGADGTGTSTINLSDEQVPPVVHLVAPPDEYARNYSWVDFSYTVFDANSSIDYCLLIASGISYLGEQRAYFDWKNNPSENATNNVTIIIDKGNYTWYVNCTDSSTNHNVGRSIETWLFRVTKTFAESFLNSCAGKCGFAGYTDGACRQNEQKCTEYPGGVWEPEFDPECQYGGSTGDFCCCFNA